MIVAYAQHGHSKDAVQLFGRLQQEGTLPDKVIYTSALSACVSQPLLVEGKRLHSQIRGGGFQTDVVVGNSLINMYMKCARLEESQAIFDEMPERNMFSWTSIIGAYGQQGLSDDACQIFHQMHQEGVMPSDITYLSMLSSCTNKAALSAGKLIHARMMGSGFGTDVVAGTSLVNMYAKCGSLEYARIVFDRMSERNTLSWTAVMAAHVECGQLKDVLHLFDEMLLEGVLPDRITFISILSSCTSITEGKKMHARIAGDWFLSDVTVGNSLINLYGNCGRFEDASWVFDKMPEPNSVSWNILIAAYAQHGKANHALWLFLHMQQEGVPLTSVTFVNVLSACACQVALIEGKRIHGLIRGSEFESDVVVGSAIINMYSKCGSLENARRTFDQMPKRNTFSWNVMLAAYGQHGKSKEAFHFFSYMQQQGVDPDSVTFVSILSACSHLGLVEEGYQYFMSMNREHGVAPVVEHYNCMIDLLGRTGCLSEAEALLNSMSFEPTQISLMTLLGACREQIDLERGERIAKRLFEVDPENAAPYVMLSNIYVAAGKDDDAARLMNKMNERGLKRQPGCSTIEVKGKVHEFIVDDQLHPQKDQIYLELQRLTVQIDAIGYVHDRKPRLYSFEEKDHNLCFHSEMLAIAFGLISTPAGTSLLIAKNLQMCPQCHYATTIICNIVGREIVIRDANRFHHMKDGVCSCGSFW